MRFLTLTALFAVGCGSHWNIRKGDELAIGCAGKAKYYEDADGDGWGNPDGEPQRLCEADAELNLTATNGRDCADDDAQVTGKVGWWCPADLSGETTIEYTGFISGESEYFYTWGTTEPTWYDTAVESCESWGAHTKDGEDYVPQGHLATFESAAAIAEMQGQLETVATSGYAVLIGVRWVGTWDEGDWGWVDQSDDSLLTAFDFCAGEAPTPDDVYEGLFIGDTGHAQFLEDTLRDLRLAMVLDDEGSWCLGLPSDVGESAEDSGYTPQEGHILCERPQPDPAEYEESQGNEETTGAPGTTPEE